MIMFLKNENITIKEYVDIVEDFLYDVYKNEILIEKEVSI